MRQEKVGLLCAAVAGIMMVIPGAAVRAGSMYDRVEELSLQELFGTRRDWRAVVFEGNDTETILTPWKKGDRLYDKSDTEYTR